MPHTPWLEEWDREQRAYFGTRHREAHFAALAAGLRPHLPAGGVVLDFGPGDALHASELRAACGHLVLCEAATRTRSALASRFAGDPHVEVIGPDDLDRRGPGDVDLLLAHSVLQYLTPDEVELLLVRAARLLRPGGVLLVGDLLAPGRAAPLRDTWHLLRFAARGRFLGPAAVSLATLPGSGYARTRRQHGLATYTVTGLTAAAAAHGLDAVRLPRNLGSNPSRWTLHARRR